MKKPLLYLLILVAFPHQIVINLGEDKVITGFSYLPRAEAGKTGMIKDYKVYLKMKPFKL